MAPFFLSDILRIPPPTLTEKNLPSQAGRVFIVTGGYDGIGLKLSSVLYSHDGTVYIAGRNRAKGTAAIEAVRAEFPSSKGRLEFILVDFADLRTIKPAAESFLARETRLDVLTNNAGVVNVPVGSVSTQGHELHMATNVLGPFLFTKLLLPVLRATAATAPPGSVRVTWAASLSSDMDSPPNGITFDADGTPVRHAQVAANYAQSKTANIFLASELARRFPAAETHIMTNAWHPGILRTKAVGEQPWLLRKLLDATIFHEPIYGAYTLLYAGWAEETGRPENNGRYVAPWGRLRRNRKDIEEGRKSKAEAGPGTAEMLWEWCERETRAFA